jgi:septal ring-binding cell division protein DamX
MDQLAEALARYEEKARRGELPGQKRPSESAATAASQPGDAPGVKTRRRACMRDCERKAATERAAWANQNRPGAATTAPAAAASEKPASAAPGGSAAGNGGKRLSVGEAAGGIPMPSRNAGGAGSGAPGAQQSESKQAPAPPASK